MYIWRHRSTILQWPFARITRLDEGGTHKGMIIVRVGTTKIRHPSHRRGRCRLHYNH